MSSRRRPGSTERTTERAEPWVPAFAGTTILEEFVEELRDVVGAPVQHRAEHLAAGLLHEVLGMRDDGRPGLFRLHDEDHPIDRFRQQAGIAAVADWRAIDDDELELLAQAGVELAQTL